VRRVASSGLSRDYEVVVGRGVLAALGEEARRAAGGTRAVVCCDENVAPLYLEPATVSLATAGYEVSHLVIPAGELQKSLSRAEEMYGVLYDRGVRRTDLMVALGGGVVGDLAGFAAATYQRGMRLVQVPTTLLAQVDAGVGGKVAVDFRAGKNYVGTFYQPWLVLADLDVLGTLPAAELRSGSAEVAKYGLLAGGELWALAGELAAGGLTAARIGDELVAGCAAYKLAVVAADEREETGARAVLNLGHTVGHAVEAATSFARYSHGEAVALGLHATLRLSRELCGLDEAGEQAGHDLLDGLGLPRRLDGVHPEQVCALTCRDKKAGADGVGYVLLDAVGVPRTGVRVAPGLEQEVVEWLTRR
jgi:3-dehydroquinate synthase